MDLLKDLYGLLTDHPWMNVHGCYGVIQVSPNLAALDASRLKIKIYSIANDQAGLAKC